MPRANRITLGGYVYHVLNRANGRLRIFRKNADFLAFEKILAQAIELYSMRICGYCIMSNHWHLLLWPVNDGDLSDFMKWIAQTHTQRYHMSHKSIGIGHLYQGRFKSFPVQDDAHYLTVLRYIEANPLRAGIVEKAEQWPWSSLAMRNGADSLFKLADGPVILPDNWNKLVNIVVEDEKSERVNDSIKRGTPYGENEWKMLAVKNMKLESTVRPRGRPIKGV